MRHSRRTTNKSRRSLNKRQRGSGYRKRSQSKNKKQKRKLKKSKRKSRRKQRGGTPPNTNTNNNNELPPLPPNDNDPIQESEYRTDAEMLKDCRKKVEKQNEIIKKYQDMTECMKKQEPSLNNNNNVDIRTGLKAARDWDNIRAELVKNMERATNPTEKRAYENELKEMDKRAIELQKRMNGTMKQMNNL